MRAIVVPRYPLTALQAVPALSQAKTSLFVRMIQSGRLTGKGVSTFGRKTPREQILIALMLNWPLSESRISRYATHAGSVAEWFKALVLKTSVRGTVPWVRIPPLPPTNHLKY